MNVYAKNAWWPRGGSIRSIVSEHVRGWSRRPTTSTPRLRLGKDCEEIKKSFGVETQSVTTMHAPLNNAANRESKTRF